MSRKAQDGQDIKEMSGDFPGGPVVGTLCFLCSRYGSIPGQGTEISHAVEELNLHVANTEPVNHNYRAQVLQLRLNIAK